MALTREQVVDTAVDLLTRFGLADLSMRRLAKELGVQPGALYYHVASKQDLLVDVAARLLPGPADVAGPSVPGAPRAVAPSGAPGTTPEGAHGASAVDTVARLATDLRAAMLPVPDAVDVVGLARALDPDSVPALTTLRSAVANVTGAGPVAAATTEAVVHHVLGSVAAHQDRQHALVGDPTLALPDDDAQWESFQTGLAVLLAGAQVVAAVTD